MNTTPVREARFCPTRRELRRVQKLADLVELFAVHPVLIDGKPAAPKWAAEAMELAERVALRPQKTRLARANGCDQPDSARGRHDPKTPAAGNRVVASATASECGSCPASAGDTPARGTLQQGTREVIV